MTLIRQLDDPNSPVRRVFDENLPRLAPAMRATWKPAMTGRVFQRAPEGAPADVLGHAISERLIWTRSPLCNPDKALLGAEVLRHAGASRGLIDELHQNASTPHEKNTERAAGAAVLIGLMDRAFRYAPALAEPWYQSAFTAQTLSDAVAQLPRPWLADVMAVTSHSAPLLAALPGTPIAGPTFAGSTAVGGADADLIIGATLVEIKAVRTAELRLRDAQQLIGYVLLDFDDTYHLTHTAILSARYGQLLTWNLDTLLEHAGGLSLAEARERLGDRLSASIR